MLGNGSNQMESRGRGEGALQGKQGTQRKQSVKNFGPHYHRVSCSSCPGEPS